MSHDLSMVPSQDLIDELRSRSKKGFVLIYDGECTPDDPNGWYLNWGDDFDRCLVLLHYAEWRMVQSFMESNPLKEE